MTDTAPFTLLWKTCVYPTLSLENHQDGVYLHRHGVTLSLDPVHDTCIFSHTEKILVHGF